MFLLLEFLLFSFEPLLEELEDPLLPRFFVDEVVDFGVDDVVFVLELSVAVAVAVGNSCRAAVTGLAGVDTVGLLLLELGKCAGLFWFLFLAGEETLLTSCCGCCCCCCCCCDWVAFVPDDLVVDGTAGFAVAAAAPAGFLTA